MATGFVDIVVVGLDAENTTRADPTEPLYDVHFVLSAKTPLGWGPIAQTHLSRLGVAERRAWPQSKAVVVRCLIGEIERVLAALGPVLAETNREYRDWSAAQDQARLTGEAFDREERQKLRELKARLGL